jgi:hypothetical protein
MRKVWIGVAALALITGCGQRPEGATAGRVAEDAVSEPPSPASAGPQIAYSYALAYRLRSSDIATVQDRQLSACRSLGSNRCLVIKSSLAGSDEGYARGEASIVVDARLAAAFNRRLDALAAEAAGTVADRSVTAEDVTKQVIDTDASVRAKEALAARLLTLIGSARGNVGELVAAEKAYADTQQDLAAARGLQAELRRRVAMSQIDITYSGREAGGLFAPVREAVRSAGETLGTSLGFLVTAAVGLFPWVLLILVLRWIARRAGWRGLGARWRGWRRPAD